MAGPQLPRRAHPRLAAGRARALGVATRGTTNPNRLRRMDNWIAARLGPGLRAAADPLVVDLGFGASPVTTIELAHRMRVVRPDVRVLGLELDAERVAAAAPFADPPRLTFGRGGFELAGHTPVLVRAANVLRQYGETDAYAAWDVLRARLAEGGGLVEGTCDELGRLGCWVHLGRSGPLSLTLACRVESLDAPSDLAPRLPKALIQHNVAGQPIHELFRELDGAWRASAPIATFGARQRWVATVRRVAATGWPVDASRARYGEVTVDWAAVALR